MNATQHNSLRRVAILVASLDQEWEEQILDSLPVKDAQRVRELLGQLTEIDPDEQQEIVSEFRAHLSQSTTPQRESVEIEPTLANRIARDEYEDTQTTVEYFRTLKSADTSFIARMLSAERPQTAALVLSKLESDRAADVLADFPPQDQADLLLRLADLHTIDDQIVQLVEAQVACWTSTEQQRQQRAQAGLELVEQILSRTTAEVRSRLVANLEERDRALAGKLRLSATLSPTRIPVPPAAVSPPPAESCLSNSSAQPVAKIPPAPETERVHPFSHFTAQQCNDALERLDTKTLQTALQACESRVVSLALMGASHKLLKRVLKRFPRAQARQFRRSLRDVGPTRVSDILAAQQELLLIARQLIA